MIKRHTLRIPVILSLGAIIATTPILSGCSSDDAQVILDLFAMDTSGGNGGQDGGSGGSGGSLNVTKNNAGNVQITNAGENAASFSATNIAAVSKNLGSNPLTITANTTLAAIDPLAPPPANQRPAAGVPYTIVNGPVFGAVYISDGAAVPVDGSLPRVTGIEVSEGAVLTLELNIFGVTADIDVANDFCNFGEVTTVDVNALQRGDLLIDAASYVGTGAINTHGTLDAQSGGSIDVTAVLNAYNSGSFNSRGSDTTAAATAAGSGGRIDFDSNFTTENTGVFDSSGGNATDGAGADGGAINLDGREFGEVLNGGALDASGGTGTTAGGSGGAVSLGAGRLGELISNADIVTIGGDATAGPGGFGGPVSIGAVTGDLRQNATITTTGGNSSAPASGAGNGGSVSFALVDSAFGPSTADRMPVGDMYVSGNIDTSGGEALATGTGNGGAGGGVSFSVNSASNPEKKSHIFVRGYSGLDARGGDGNQGSIGGNVSVSITPATGTDDVTYAAGTIDFNGVDVNARGGNVVAGATVFPAQAGPGGRFNLATPFQKGFNRNESMTARSTADIAVSGGTGTSNAPAFSNAFGGFVSVWGYDGASSSGDVASDGGTDVGADGGTDGLGANGGGVQVLSELGAASSTGGLSLNGGDGEFRGGQGGIVTIIGFNGASNGGDISANGGNADAALANSTGGFGGHINIETRPGATPSNTGAVSFTGGTGATPGLEGSLQLNDSCTGDGC